MAKSLQAWKDLQEKLSPEQNSWYNSPEGEYSLSDNIDDCQINRSYKIFQSFSTMFNSTKFNSTMFNYTILTYPMKQMSIHNLCVSNG